MTETRVLCDYLFKIVLPLPGKLGLYHDDFIVSKSLFNPWSTITATAFLLFLLGFAILLKKRAPVYSFGILWFFSGHLLESTIIPLELYFEHRNYLPVLGIITSAIYYGAKLRIYFHTPLLKQIGVGFAALYSATIVFISYQEDILWGNTYKQAITWAAEKPKSLRAQDGLGALLTATKQYGQAASVYKKMAITFPNDAAPYVIWFSLTCLDPAIKPPPIDTTLHKLENSPAQKATLNGLVHIIEAKETKDCDAIEYKDVARLIIALMQNPKYKRYTMHLHLYLGRVYAAQRLFAPAVMEFDKAFAISHKAATALQQVQWLYFLGSYDQARVHLKKAEQATQRNPLLRLSLKPVFSKWHKILQNKTG
jgi:tetratricopeptide (TPR) repeat protein